MSLIKTNINYSGKEVNEILRVAFSEAYFTSKFGARVTDAVKSKYTYSDISIPGSLQAYETCPDTFGNVGLNQRTVELCEYMFLVEMDKNSLVATIRERYLSQGFNSESPMDDTLFTQNVTDAIIEKVSDQWNDIILNGDSVYGSGHLALCDGFLVRWEEDTDVIDVTSTTVTSSNVLTELGKIYSAIPKKFKGSTNPRLRFKIAVPINMWDAYFEKLSEGNASFNASYNPEMSAPLRYRDLELVPLFHLPDNTAFATYSDNLVLVYDDAADFAELRSWDLSESRPCDLIQMRLKARGGVEYGYGTDIVFYHS